MKNIGYNLFRILGMYFFLFFFILSLDVFSTTVTRPIKFHNSNGELISVTIITKVQNGTVFATVDSSAVTIFPKDTTFTLNDTANWFVQYLWNWGAGDTLASDEYIRLTSSNITASDMASIADSVLDEVNTGATHNIVNSLGRQIRELQELGFIRRNTAQAGGTVTITLDAGASPTDGAFDPSGIFIVGGTGAGQTRNIIEYNGTTKKAIVDRSWKVIPDATSEFVIFPDAGREHVNEGLATGGTSTTITLNTLASSANDAYNGQIIFIRGGVGEDQVKEVIDYNGTTKIATIRGTWTVTPTDSSAYVMLPSAVTFVSQADMSEIADSVWSVNRDALLKSLVVSNSAGDAVQFTSTGSGGNGFTATGFGSGSGIRGIGGATNGSFGMHLSSSASIGNGALIVGTSSGDGLVLQGGVTGDGLDATTAGAGADIRGDIVGSITSVVSDIGITATAVDNIWNEDSTGHYTSPNMAFVASQTGGRKVNILFDLLSPHVGTVNDATPTASQFVVSANIGSFGSDFFNDLYLTFTTGNLKGRTKRVTDFETINDTIFITGFFSAPANADSFVINAGNYDLARDSSFYQGAASGLTAAEVADSVWLKDTSAVHGGAVNTMGERVLLAADTSLFAVIEDVWRNQDTVNVDSSVIGTWLVNNLSGSGGLTKELIADAVLDSMEAGTARDIKMKSLVVSNSAGDAVQFTSTGTNGNGLAVTGQGTGDGLNAQSGTGANAEGIFAKSNGSTGRGAYFLGGTIGDGLLVEGQGGQNGLSALGQGSGSGIKSTAGNLGVGLDVTGGATSGIGLKVTSNSDDAVQYFAGGAAGDGIQISGSGTGDGIKAQSGTGTDAEGIYAVSLGTTGRGIYALGGTIGDGILAQGQGGQHGIEAQGEAAGSGIHALGGTLGGFGIYAIGDTTVDSAGIYTNRFQIEGTNGALGSFTIKNNSPTSLAAAISVNATGPAATYSSSGSFAINLTSAPGVVDLWAPKYAQEVADSVDADLTVDHGPGAWNGDGIGSDTIIIVALDTSGIDLAIQDVLVTIKNAAGATVISGFTDGTGSKTFFLDPGTFTLLGRATGFEWVSRSLIVAGNSTDTLFGQDLAIGSPTSGDMVRVFGYLRDAGDSVIVSAEIEAIRVSSLTALDTTGVAVIIGAAPVVKTSDTLGFWFIDLRKTTSFADTTKGFYNITAKHGGQTIFSIQKFYAPDISTINLADSLIGR